MKATVALFLISCQFLIFLPATHSQLCLADDIKQNTEYKYKARNLYKGLTIFTANFLDAMHKSNPNENLFFSPFSLYHALLLAYFGSANQTEKGLKEVLQLHWANSKADVFKGYQFEKRYRDNYEANSSVEFSSIDRFYFDENVKLNPCIEDVIVDETRKLDFRQKPNEALNEINNFVNESTKGNIPVLLSPGDVTGETKIVLANAAYFKGSWASKFDAKDTKREIFYSRPDELHFVEMMSKNGSFNHGKCGRT
jgi:serine protease inhibitor